VSGKQGDRVKMAAVFVAACATALALASPGWADGDTVSACDPAPCSATDDPSGAVASSTEPLTADPTTTVVEPSSTGDGGTVEASGSETTPLVESTPVAVEPENETLEAGTDSSGSTTEPDLPAPAVEPEQPILPIDVGSDAASPDLDPSPSLAPAPEVGPPAQAPGDLIPLIMEGLEQGAPPLDWLAPASANPADAHPASAKPADRSGSRQSDGSPGKSNTPLPPSGPSAPSPGAAAAGGGPGNGFSFECFAALVAAISIGVVRRRSRRSSLSTAVWCPVAFVSLPEQPG
jgi:hypothetical protein